MESINGNRRYSISNKDKKIAKKKSDIDKVYHKMEGYKMYLGALSGFFIITLLIIISPIFLGKSYNYPTVQLNSPLNIVSSLTVSVYDMEINKDDGLFKAVLRYEDQTNQKSLSNIEYNYNLNYITNNGKSSAEQKVVKLDDEFTILYFENLPNDFGVISITIEPSYIHPELEVSNDLANREIKFYAVDKDISVNNDLIIEPEEILHQKTFLFEIEIIKELIEEEKETIRTANTAIDILNEDIKKLEDKIEFQLTNDQVSTRNEINTKTNMIETRREEITIAENNITQYENKIERLEEIIKGF